MRELSDVFYDLDFNKQKNLNFIWCQLRRWKEEFEKLQLHADETTLVKCNCPACQVLNNMV